MGTKTKTTTDLSVLANEINVQHARVVAAERGFVNHARKAGELLLQAKDELPHGRWLPWVGEYFAGSVRQAQNYMRLAEHPNTQRVAHLSLREALAAMASPRPSAPEPPESRTGLRESLSGVSAAEVAEARAELGAPVSTGFPVRGVQTELWERIGSDIAQLQGSLREVRLPGLQTNSRREALGAAAAHAMNAYRHLQKLSVVLRDEGP